MDAGYGHMAAPQRHEKFVMHTEKTIAIVDDDEGVRISLASLLRSFGYRVSTYGSALAFLDSGEQPDCMVVDIQMPAMQGDELQARLIADGRRIPMIFMTAFPTEAVRSRVLAAGGLAFLEKPADTDRLVRELEHAVA